MDNIMDYLRWRGDLSFTAAPFCVVDSLIMAELSYMDFSGIVDENDYDAITVCEAAERFFSNEGAEKTSLGLLVPSTIVGLFRDMAKTERFGKILLGRYVNIVNDDMQFSALCARLGDGTRAVVYRGTDDTIIGWKENFEMSYLEAVPAQVEAVDYLQEAAFSFPEKLRVMGHSKGGNLAAFASVNASEVVQNQILAVCNFDGPGFEKSETLMENYARIRERLHTFLPQGSIVGLLLEHDEDYAVVRSKNVGVFQHDGFSWEVTANDFGRLSELSLEAKKRDVALHEWVTSVEPQQRRQCTETLFSLLQSTGAKTLTQLTAGGLKSSITMLNNMRGLDKESRDVMTHILKLLILETMKPRTSV